MSLMVQLASIAAGRDDYAARYGDPRDWSGDWRHCPNGNYLTGDKQREVSAMLASHDRLVIAMAIRCAPNTAIGAVFGVSREAVAKRLRPLGLNTTRGAVAHAARKKLSTEVHKSIS